MASLWITEFKELMKDDSGHTVPVGRTPPVKSQKVDFTTSVQSAAFGVNTNFVRVVSDVNAHLLFAGDPTATVDHMRLTADVAEYFGVEALQKVAVYDGTS